MPEKDRMARVRLRVDLEEPIEEPTKGQLANEVQRLAAPDIYGVTLERVGSAEGPTIDCVWTTLGWYLTRRGEDPTDVDQGLFRSEASALHALVAWSMQTEGWHSSPEFRALRPERFPEVDTTVHHWVRSVWEEEAIVFIYEFNSIGVALRAIETRGDEAEPIAAASLTEWRDGQRGLMQPQTPVSRRYALRFGGVPDGSEHDWGDYPRDNISNDEFDAVWARARSHLRQHPRGYP